MPKFFENLLSFLHAFPRYAQLSIYILILIAGIYIYKALNAEPVSSLEGYSHLVANRPSDSLITSSGSAGNYIFVTKHGKSPLTYWPNYQEFEREGQKRKNARYKGETYKNLLKYGTLCVYNADFHFGYQDRGKIVSWFAGDKNTPLHLPQILSSNIYDQQNMATKYDGITLASKCMEYVTGVDQAREGWASLTQACLKGAEGRCIKQRMARWLQTDGVLKDHLKQGLISAATIASGERRRCQRLNASQQEKVAIPSYCSVYLANGQTLTQASINENLTKLLTYLDDVDLNQCYQPHTGTLNAFAQCQSPETTQVFEAEEAEVTAANISIFSAAYANNPGSKVSLPSFPEQVTNTAFMQTFSTLAVFSALQEKWLDMQDDEYAFRKDVSQVYYGVDIPTQAVSMKKKQLGHDVVYQLLLPEPEVKSINRWAQDYGYIYDNKPNLLSKVAHEKGGTIYSVLNDKIQALLQAAIDRNEKQAIAQAKKVLENRYAIDQLEIHFGEPIASIETEFKSLLSVLSNELSNELSSTSSF